jgi:hypothetical protein
MPPKPAVTDKFCQKLYHQNNSVPPFATEHEHFVRMWDDDEYSVADKRNIYESVILVVLRKVWSISDQEQLEPVMLEMALVKFLEIWLQWTWSHPVEPESMDRGPNAETHADPADIPMYGNNRAFLQSVGDIT